MSITDFSYEHSIFIDYFVPVDIMETKGSDRMRKKLVRSVCVVILTVLMLCSGCGAVLQELENAEVRQSTEEMLNALIANDFQTAYSLVSKICAEEDFKPTFTQMRELLGNADTYELKLLSIYTNGTLTNGQKFRSVNSTYEMTTNSGRVIVSVRMDDRIGLSSFYLSPYEKTDYYFTGTLENMKDATGLQWCFLLLNVVAIGFTVFALVDCSRQKIKKKALWILLLLIGFVSDHRVFCLDSLWIRHGYAAANAACRNNYLFCYAAFAVKAKYAGHCHLRKRTGEYGRRNYLRLRTKTGADQRPNRVHPRCSPKTKTNEDFPIRKKILNPKKVQAFLGFGVVRVVYSSGLPD